MKLLGCHAGCALYADPRLVDGVVVFDSATRARTTERTARFMGRSDAPVRYVWFDYAGWFVGELVVDDALHADGLVLDAHRARFAERRAARRRVGSAGKVAPLGAGWRRAK